MVGGNGGRAVGGGDDRVGGSGVNGRVDWWNNLVMGGGGRVRCEEDIGRGVGRVKPPFAIPQTDSWIRNGMEYMI